MMPAAHLIVVERRGGVAGLTFNRPSQRNALSVEMMDEMIAALDAVAAREDAPVLLLRGNGPAFCAGFDLGAAVNRPDVMVRYIEQLAQITRRLRRLPQVVVAAVQGAAVAGGCAIVAACDFVFAGPEAQFGYPVHRLGISPAVNIPVLRQTIGDGAAREVLLSGRLFGADEAQRLGLVSRKVASTDAVQPEAQAWCTALCEKGITALRATKQWIGELDGSLNDAAFDDAMHASAQGAAESEGVALLARFWEKRRG